MNIIDATHFIKTNYKKMSKFQMAKHIGICGHTVKKIMKKHEFTLSEEEKFNILHNCHLKPLAREKVKTETFSIINTPEKAYCMGLLWADGHINSRSVRVNCLKSDLSQVLDVFYSTGDWSYKEYVRPASPNVMLMLTTANMRLSKRFIELDYHIKSGASADKILSEIPTSLKRYWWRGYFDGDGCINISYKHRSKTLLIASCFSQDWSFAETLFNDLGSDFKIIREINKKRGSGGSSIRIRSIGGIYKFFDYIYGSDSIKFGFKRKYNKFVEIFKFKQKINNKQNNFLKDISFDYWL